MSDRTRIMYLIYLALAAVALRGFTNTMAWAHGWNIIGAFPTIAALVVLSAVALRAIIALSFNK